MSKEDQVAAENNLSQNQTILVSLDLAKKAEQEKLEAASNKLSENLGTLEGIVGQILEIEEDIKDAEEVKSTKGDDVRAHVEANTDSTLLVLAAENSLQAAQDLQSAGVQKLQSAQNLKIELSESHAEDLSELSEDKDDLEAAKLTLEEAQKYHSDTQTRYNETKATFDIHEKQMDADDEELMIKFRQQAGLKANIELWSKKSITDNANLNLAISSEKTQCV